MTEESERAMLITLSAIIWKYGNPVLDEAKEIEYHIVELSDVDFINFGHQSIEMVVDGKTTYYRVRKVNA